MSADSNLDMVRNSPFGSELTGKQCEELAAIINVRNLAGGEFLIREGKVDHSLYVTVAGELAVTKSTGAGEEQLHVLAPGSLAGAMGFLDGQEHSASLKAISDAKVFSIERSNFETLIEKNPMVVYQVMKTIVRDIHSIVKKMNTSHVEFTNYISRQHGRY